jgi:hypothetical protein
MMFKVLPDRSFGLSQVPAFHSDWSAEISGGMPLAALHPATHALQPTQSVES